MTNGASQSRRAAAAATIRLALLCGIAVAGTACGLQKGSPAGSATTTTRPAAGTACGPASLRAAIDVRATGVAAGTLYLPVDFTNISTANCTLDGYPTVTLAASRSGRQIGGAAVTDRGLAPENLVVAAGQAAHIWLRIASVANLPASSCQPVTAAGLRIALPGPGPATFVRYPIMTCGRTVHGTQVLIVEPFQPGRARRGTAQ